ncbi:CPBP family glutamic-type intramembrane protease [Sporosarcina sp. ACRSM]|uniref:CPBP family glutamic-type intramembrane protease n=1 Tax=Sporosarcina sp. ACRSM TaxID=2918216 RepID=UPI001EF6C7E0|nr:CPBP family glutamic-type intramembrane protease [Sporosarcina sp. ACRSM]MCG7334887.1 CPBP family glutamic-type intramembrane protease [Sporosarcina sp. ACRSM]
MRTVIGILSALASIAILIWIEQVLEVTYLLKTVAKATLFLLVPFILFRKTGFPFFRLRQTDRKSMNIAIVFGIAIMGTILATFILLQPFIDIDALVDDLADAGVTSIVFPFVAFYILFGNSLLEEFFFRGLLPSFLDRPLLRLLLPSFFFAIYHIAIFLPWFSTPILLLAVAGLWIGGIIFQLVNERSGTILPSWIIHMFADVGVLIVGVYMIYFY